jgi:hypothetical protein
VLCTVFAATTCAFLIQALQAGPPPIMRPSHTGSSAGPPPPADRPSSNPLSTGSACSHWPNAGPPSISASDGPGSYSALPPRGPHHRQSEGASPSKNGSLASGPPRPTHTRSSSQLPQSTGSTDNGINAPETKPRSLPKSSSNSNSSGWLNKLTDKVVKQIIGMHRLFPQTTLVLVGMVWSLLHDLRRNVDKHRIQDKDQSFACM